MSIHPEDHRDDPDHDAAALTGGALVAQRRALVRGIRIAYEPQKEFVTALDDLVQTALLGRGLPMPGVRLLAPSFSGKSTVSREYAARINASDARPEGCVPVLYVKLDSEGSFSSLATDVLRAMGERRPDSLTPPKRWERVRRALRDNGVLLIIFDEFQRAGRRPTVHPVIAGKIMDLMEDPDCSVACAFVGKTDAKAIFKASTDLGNRLDAPVEMGKLLWSEPEHREMFTRFVDAFDEALVEQGVIVAKAGFAKPLTAQLLLESSSGMIGQFCRIVESAIMAITRRGQGGITIPDLAEAVDEWAIGNERINYNPFRQEAEAK